MLPKFAQADADSTNSLLTTPPSGMFDTGLSAPLSLKGALQSCSFCQVVINPIGAPRFHVHHEQDEWIYVMTGEFVAKVGGERMRLKAGDSLLMPRSRAVHAVPRLWADFQARKPAALKKAAGFLRGAGVTIRASPDLK
jgi:mannose-6-phosphate isomerase-like protein (cupin superfamily)